MTHSCVVCHSISPKNILTGISNRLFELLSQSVHFRLKRDLLFICKVNNSIITTKKSHLMSEQNILKDIGLLKISTANYFTAFNGKPR